FGDPFMIEVRDLLTKYEILEKGGPAIAGFEGILIVVDSNALIGGESLAGTVFGVLCQIVEFEIVRARCGIVRGRCFHKLTKLILAFSRIHRLLPYFRNSLSSETDIVLHDDCQNRALKSRKPEAPLP